MKTTINFKWKKVSIITLFFLFTLSQAFSQEEYTLYHVNHKNRVETNEATEQKIQITEDCLVKTKDIVPKVFTFFIEKIIAPYAFKVIKNTFYNPKKYINSSSGTYNLISESDSKNLSQISCLRYSKFDDKDENLRLQFSLKDITTKNRKLKDYRVLNFEEIDMKRSRSKIKNKAKQINVIVEISIDYYTKQGKKESLTLSPFQVNGITPNGQSSSSIELTENFRIIPKLYAPKSIQIKVTEVNARKKDMDKWLELYNKHEKDIQALVLETILKKN